MEGQQPLSQLSSEFSNALHPHRKPLLKSETYFSLVRILSLCDEHPHLWQTAPKLPPVGKNPEEKSQVHDKNLECLASESSGIGVTTKVAAVREIESILGLDEDEDNTLMQDDSVVDKIMELDHVMNVDGTSVDDYQSERVVACEEGCVDIQPVNVEVRLGSEQRVKEEGRCRDASDCLGSLSGKGGALGASGGSDQDGVKLKEIDLDKPISDSSTMVSPNCVVVNCEVEEGEVNGELEAGEGSSLLHSKHAGMLQGKKVDEKKLDNEVIPGMLPGTKVDEKQLASDGIDGSRKRSSSNITTGNQFPPHKRNVTTRGAFCSTSSAVDRVENFDFGNGMGNKHEVGKSLLSNRRTVVYDNLLFNEGPKMWEDEKNCQRDKGQKNKSNIAERKKDNKGRELGEVKGHALKGSVAKTDVRSADPCPSSLALSVETSSKDPMGSQRAASQEKDASPSKNKKRGPLSDSQKLKRKQKKRKKRAEEKKEHGVKRLKLQPCAMQSVGICRHYIMGKCWEGEKCKFSHDAIPLTKSKPCKFFVRDACMKGADCPHDHELSKYPCDNYKSTGYCSRGQNCLFSHKLLPNGEVSTASRVNPNSSVLSQIVDSKKKLDVIAPLHQSGKAASVQAVVSSTKIKQAPGKTVQNENVIVPAVRPLLVGTSHMDQPSPGTISNSNSVLKVTPQAVRPKGINFLSFGRSPLEFSAAKKSSTSPITRDDASKSPLSNITSVHQQIPDGKPVTDDVAQKSDHIAPSGNLNPFSLGETSAADGNRYLQCHLPSSSGHGTASTGQGSSIALSKNQSLSAIPLRLASSPFGSGQSSDHIALLQLKNAPSSTQKALMSTMDFAAKLESEMKKKQKVAGFGNMP